MEGTMVKFYSKESHELALHAVPGHFATSHSHINYYIDVTSIKTRVKEARAAAKILAHKAGNLKYVDTIVCMDGTEMIGAFLAEQFEKRNIQSKNQHETYYVVSPEINYNNQMIFRDNMKNKILGKHIILLLDTTTTGATVRRSLECIRYYGGMVESVYSIFSTNDSVDGKKIETIFNTDDIPEYEAHEQKDCPLCAKGMKLEAMVNGFGYSEL